MLNKQVKNEVKILKKNKKPLSFQKVDAEEKVKHIKTSCFIQENNVIIRGESSTSTFWKKKLKILAVDGVTKELRGENGFDGIHLT